MSRFFGPPTQQGVVVHSLEAALEYWTGVVGAGPFFVIDDVQHTAFQVGDTPTPPPQMRIALGNWGDLQIELIEPQGDSPATWHRFLRECGGGAHHTSVWTADYDATIEAALQRGLSVEVAGQLANRVRYCYFRSPERCDPLVEVSELLPEVAAGYEFIRSAAIDWDGANPVRRFV
jgi:hypothetical protein